MSIQKAIREKIPVFIKLALIISVASIIIQGLIKLIWKVDWFDLEVNQRVSEFWLFKNEIAQIVILQISLMFNYVIVIAIANKAKIKDVIKKTWFLLILTYLFNYVDKNIASLLVTASGIIISIIYNICIKSNFKDIVKSSLKVFIISIILLIYQYLTIIIRMNHVPNANIIYGFYETMIFVIDMYVVAYFYYLLQRRRL